MTKRTTLAIILAILAGISAALLWGNPRTGSTHDDTAAVVATPSAASSAVAAESSPAPAVQSTAPRSTAAVETSSASPSPTPQAPRQPLVGAQLAQAWLRGYLTRPTGATDTTWQKVIAPLSDPALVKTLATPDSIKAVGITYPSWHVTAIKPTKLPSQPIDTPSRQTSSWLVTIAGPGKASSARLYTLTAYLGDNGWSIAQADQGYTSQG